MHEELKYSDDEMAEMVDAVLKGATLGDVFNMDSDALEAGYGLAYSLYTAGNFTDAETMFRGLCLYDHNDTRFWMGLGGCRQALNDFVGAVDAYAVAVCTSALGDPSPALYAAHCQLKLGEKEKAITLFKAASEMGNTDNEEYAACHQKARAMLDILKKGE